MEGEKDMAHGIGDGGARSRNTGHCVSAENALFETWLRRGIAQRFSSPAETPADELILLAERLFN